MVQPETTPTCSLQQEQQQQEQQEQQQQEQQQQEQQQQEQQQQEPTHDYQKHFTKFLTKFHKSKHIPADVTPDLIKEWYDEVLAFIMVPGYEHELIIKVSEDMKIKVIKIGVANCWVREKLKGYGYSHEEITKVQKELGSEMFFSLTPMWKVASDRVAKMKKR